MNLSELVEQWRSSAANTGDAAFANGILNCAEDLTDYITQHAGEAVQ